MAAPTSGRIATDLELRGMTCASCAGRVERGLNSIAGVHATVNLAVERAHVEHDAGISTTELIRAVEATGYQAAVLGEPARQQPEEVAPQVLPARLVVSAVLAVPVVALSMVMAWQFVGWQWLVLALTTPIVLWGGYPFHRAALRSARHGASTMDTLVSLGTLAAYLWSAVTVVRDGS
ncbi:MAG: cation transporter, partial [Mycobacterium sp.]